MPDTRRTRPRDCLVEIVALLGLCLACVATHANDYGNVLGALTEESDALAADEWVKAPQRTQAARGLHAICQGYVDSVSPLSATERESLAADMNSARARSVVYTAAYSREFLTTNAGDCALLTARILNQGEQSQPLAREIMQWAQLESRLFHPDWKWHMENLRTKGAARFSNEQLEIAEALGSIGRLVHDRIVLPYLIAPYVPK